MVGGRLPILILTGPAEDLKVRLANSLVQSSASSYAVIAESAMSAMIVEQEQAVQRPRRFNVDGCLCCVGAVTLMAQLTRLLRAQRRENNHRGILLVAGAQTKSAVLLDQLRQPLLADLVKVSTVVYVCSRVLEIQADDIVAADVLYAGEQQNGVKPLDSTHWLADLPGNEDRVLMSDFAQLPGLVLPVRDARNKMVWPAERVFDRQKLQRLFEQAAKDGLYFDAVFRTQRAWYRWRKQCNAQRLAPTLETAYRRQSYLHWHPSEGTEITFNTLKSAIAIED